MKIATPTNGITRSYLMKWDNGFKAHSTDCMEKKRIKHKIFFTMPMTYLLHYTCSCNLSRDRNSNVVYRKDSPERKAAVSKMSFASFINRGLI